MVGFTGTAHGQDFVRLRLPPQPVQSLPVSPYEALFADLYSSGTSQETLHNIEQTRRYVHSFWDKLIVFPEDFDETDSKNGRIPLPEPYIMPMVKGGLHARFFYWDSYFMIMPHVGTDTEYLALGIVENCAYLFEKYQVIPNQADIRFLSRSQPPVFTSMIMDVYHSLEKQHKRNRKAWLKRYMEIAKKEYQIVWIAEHDTSKDEKDTYNHRKYPFTLLSNWGDRDIGSHHPSEYESGKDTTAEFAGRAGDFLPVDLNCFLLKYEKDFMIAAGILEDKKEENYWREKSEQRIEEMNTYLWDGETGYFYNYDVASGQKDSFKTLSGFQALWSGLATKEQAEKIVQNLTFFETIHGLMTTASESIPLQFEQLNIAKLKEAGIQDRYLQTIHHMLLPGQWCAPNIWSPTQMMAVLGLIKYGYVHQAKRIMQNSIISLSRFYSKHKTLPEKRNGYTGEGGGDHTYPEKYGFGWTNAEFAVYLDLLQKMVIGIPL